MVIDGFLAVRAARKPVAAKYRGRCLAGHPYRFNDRHDLNGLFQRALTTRLVAHPVTAGELFR